MSDNAQFLTDLARICADHGVILRSTYGVSICRRGYAEEIAYLCDDGIHVQDGEDYYYPDPPLPVERPMRERDIRAGDCYLGSRDAYPCARYVARVRDGTVTWMIRRDGAPRTCRLKSFVRWARRIDYGAPLSGRRPGDPF